MSELATKSLWAKVESQKTGIPAMYGNFDFAIVPERFADQSFGVGNFRYRPGIGFAYNGAVVIDPTLAGDIVGRGTYFWDGAAGTWFWIDPENRIAFVGMIQRLGPPGGPAMQDLVRPVAYQPGCLAGEPTPAG